MTTETRTPQPIAGAPSAWRVRAIAVAGAVAATSLLWLVARILGIDLWVDPHNGQPAGPVSLTAVLAFTLVFSLLGWGVLAALERFTRRAHTIWTILALAMLAVSFVPLVYVEATPGTKIILTLMHLAVACVLVPLLRRSGTKAVA
ncbi:hypothetical protein GCM10022226_09140 [Sphaerisporangium flaviroseum]|uniref:Uncharacterized protein n=1 Tax=Sphaerisporangium flaviroseum TaxID=509199 RepID=A0ABP7HHX9_9ACTN